MGHEMQEIGTGWRGHYLDTTVKLVLFEVCISGVIALVNLQLGVPKGRDGVGKQVTANTQEPLRTYLMAPVFRLYIRFHF